MAGKNQIEIALIGAQFPFVVKALEQRFIVHPIYAALDPDEALRQVGANIRAAVGHGMAGLTRRAMDLMPNLEICAINGVGLETTDLTACRERGITLTTTPVLFEDVADLAIALALACCRQIVRADRFVRAGRWSSERLQAGRRFSGTRTGIMGLGRIGSEVARRLDAFNCRIGYVDPQVLNPDYQRWPDAVSMSENCDIVFLCAAGGPKGSPPMVGREMLDAIGPRGIFINVARGWLVDEPALAAALSDGRLGAAGLDVFSDEPSLSPGLVGLDNVILTPHIASSTEETQRAMGECVIENLKNWFEGRGAVTPVDLNAIAGR